MRDGILLLLYDIPVSAKGGTTREYRKLFKTLKKEGYQPFQKSVFYKYLRNLSMSDYEIERLRALPIREGEIACLPVSFRDFRRLVTVRGEAPDFEAIRAPYIYL